VYGDILQIEEVKKGVGEAGLDLLGLIDRLCGSPGMGSAFGTALYVGDGVRLSTILVPSKENATELEKAVMAPKPRKGSNRNYVPKETLVYLASDSLPDPLKAYTAVMKLWQADSRGCAWAQLAEQLELSLDIDIKSEVLPFIGDEAAFIFEGFDIEEFGFPVPRMAVILKVKDKEKAGAFADKLTTSLKELVSGTVPETGLETVSFEGLKISVFEIRNPLVPDGKAIDPCYVFADDFLLIGTSLDQVKSMIRVSKGRAIGLIDSSVYKSAAIPEKTNGFMFLNWEEVIGELDAVAAWIIRFDEARGKGEEARELVETHIAPLLRILRAVKQVSGYYVNTPLGRERKLHIGLEDLTGI
jgi:hypothetical protein